MRSIPTDLPEGVRLLVAAEQTGDRDVLDQAIAWLSTIYEAGEATLAMPTGRAYALRWEWRDQNADAEKAVAVLSTISVPVQAAVMAQAMIGKLLGQRYERHGEPEDLDAAIETLQAVVAATPLGSPQHTGRTRTLCRFLLRAGVDRESVAALETAAEAARAALASALPGDPSRPYLVGTLGSAELERFRRGAIDDDLPAIRLIAEAAQQVTEPGERHQVLLALGNAVSQRTRRLRDPADADHAVGLLEQAVRVLPQQDPEVLVHLGVALTIRAELTLRPDDMRDAATTLSNAVDLAPPGSEVRMRALGSLADVRRQLVEMTGDRAQLDAAVDMANEAVSLAVTHGDQHAVSAAMCNLGLALVVRARLDNNPADLDLALRHLHAVEDQPTSSGNEAPRRNAIGQAYLARYPMIGAPEDLQEAVRWLDRALSAPPEPAPQTVLALGRCLVLLATKHEDLAGPDDLDRAISLLRKAHESLGRTDDTAEALGMALFAKYRVTGEHALVEEANQLLDGRLQAHVARPSADIAFAEALVRGGALLDEYKATGRGAVLDAAVETLRAAVPGADEDPALVAELFSKLGVSLRHRYLRHRRLEDLDEAVAAGKRAVDEGPAGDHGVTAWLANLANTYRVRFENTHDGTDLDAAIALSSKAVEATSPGHPHHLSVHTSLANALMVRYEADGRQEDLDRAIASSRIAASGDRPRHLANLGAKLLRRETRTDLEEAIGLLERALDRYDPQDPERAGVAANLVLALNMRRDQDPRPDDLDAIVDVAEIAFDAALPGHPARLHALGALAGALHERFQHDERREDLHRTIGLYREQLTLLDERSADHARVRSDLGVALYHRHQHGGVETDLDEAIRLLESVPEQVGPIARINLALAFRQRFLVTGDRADLRAAVHDLRTAADRSSGPHQRGYALSNLSVVLCELAEIDDDTGILDEAVESARRAENLLAPGHPDLVVAVTNLCQSLRTRFERTSAPDDLDAAVEAGRRAVRLSPASAGAQSALGNAYQARHEWSDQLVDLEAAVGAHKAALAGFSRGHPLFAGAAHNLGNVLMRIYEVRSDRADLEESIRLSREAVTATGAGDPTRASSLVNLGIAMRKRFAVTEDGNDLSEAIGAFRQALDCFGRHPDEPVRASVLANLGNALRDRYERVGLQSDLSDAIDAFQQARASLQGTARLAVVLRALGDALLLGDRPAPHEALEVFREAAGLLVAEPRVRVDAARGWAALAHRLGDVEQTALGLAVAVGLLPLVTWHGLDAETRTRQLMRYRGLAADARRQRCWPDARTRRWSCSNRAGPCCGTRRCASGRTSALWRQSHPSSPGHWSPSARRSTPRGTAGRPSTAGSSRGSGTRPSVRCGRSTASSTSASPCRTRACARRRPGLPSS
ncbi:tetratricopeptide repeat protein [Lentzea sp. PSKA42]|uniref:Tetratricopeptide repeat protein n=1 Tax=Lentzea indica TaxID=2604800 RepID=A0ABX1FUD8_9PSEU|nr:tetratricopeptide repeat protein [Lentzea indica]NKE62449.1 tetratricopeptide repeat protein [Lentzea indica]